MTRQEKITLGEMRAMGVRGLLVYEAVKALIVANQFLETDLEKLKAAVSTGYSQAV